MLCHGLCYLIRIHGREPFMFYPTSMISCSCATNAISLKEQYLPDEHRVGPVDHMPPKITSVFICVCFILHMDFKQWIDRRISTMWPHVFKLIAVCAFCHLNLAWRGLFGCCILYPAHTVYSGSTGKKFTGIDTNTVRLNQIDLQPRRSQYQYNGAT